ncbi:hypothetical protein TL16_g10545 [Triparma laevis f. inornata]|uniref:HMG box domain-containing protein n=1 Tax=Triparma laevis f. inornata TaxID=1714386 RepID=A0A9W7BEH0_9STRA|nr:hypothetical protein TL16_g10545 [Triparma laevis f. inornata]
MDNYQILYFDKHTNKFCRALIERKRRDDRGYSAEWFGHVRVRRKEDEDEDEEGRQEDEGEGEEEAEEKDPNASKKAKSAYIFFSVAKRVTLKEAEPEMKQTDMMKKCGELWKTISEDEKAIYVKMAEEDKIRYLSEMKAYEVKAKEEKEKNVKSTIDEEKILTEVPRPSHYGVSILYNRPSLLAPLPASATQDTEIEIIYEVELYTPELGLATQMLNDRIVVTKLNAQHTFAKKVSAGSWLHAIGGNVLPKNVTSKEIIKTIQELPRPLNIAFGKRVRKAGAAKSRLELVDKVCRITDPSLFFMKMNQSRNNMDSASWRWREISPLRGLDPHEKLMLISKTNEDEEQLEFLQYAAYVCEHLGAAGSPLNPWSRIPEGYVKEKALRVGGSVSEVNFEPEAKGIPAQARSSLQDEEYVVGGVDYSALKLSEEELNIVAFLMKTVGRGNKASDLGVSYQQHVGFERTTTFEKMREMVTQGQHHHLTNVTNLRPPVDSTFVESNDGIRLPGLTGLAETLTLFRTVPKVLGLYLLAQKRAGEAQESIEADTRMKQKRQFDVTEDHPARRLHKIRLEVVYEAIYTELKDRLTELGVPEITFSENWMKFDAMTVVLSTREANVFPHFDRLNSVKRPWVHLEIAQIEVKGEMEELPPITFCPPNRSCPADEYVIVDANKSYSVPDLDRILHFARPNNIEITGGGYGGVETGLETEAVYCRLAFVLFHKGWIETAENQRTGKSKRVKDKD